MDISKFFKRKELNHSQPSLQQPDADAADEPAREDEALGTEVQTGAESECDDLGTLQTGPKQVKLQKYPFTEFGSQQRAFNKHWLDAFQWLEYSVSRNSAFCFPCRHFGKHHIRNSKDSLTSAGFSNWKRGLDSFREHEQSSIHKDSMTCWKSYKTTKTHGDIAEQLHSASVGEITERRKYLHRVVAVTLFLGKQGIAFRGHDEQSQSQNQGNFLECMKLLSQFDPFLQQYKAPSHATYLSHSSQNEMIACVSEEVTENIIKEMQISKMYALMADEARDRHSEQLAVCVRYVTPEGRVKENFLGFCKLLGFDAQSITDAIEQKLKSHKIDNLMCVAQTYDGASVMSGAVGGVQARFRVHHPEAVYLHCYAHELNLVLCHACKAIHEATNFFDLLGSLYSFFSVSLVNHQKFTDVQKQLGLQSSELVQLSTTRWACQVKSVSAVIDNFSAILQCLDQISTPMAVGLRSRICKFKTVYMLLMFHRLLAITEGLHRFLQGENIDLAQAVQYKTAVYDSLKEQRTDQSASELYAKTKALCEANNIPEPSVGFRRKQKRLDDYVVETACGTTSEMSSSHDYMCTLYYPCLERMLQEIDSRFSGVGVDLMKGIQACHPASDTFLHDESLKVLATHYKIELQPEELLVAKNFLNRKKKEEIPDIVSVFKLLNAEMFPSLNAVFQVALTIPVSSCSCERSFSVLRRLHTWLRTTMEQDRLNHLAVMSIENENLSAVDHDKVIDRFAQMKSRRYSLILPP